MNPQLPNAAALRDIHLPDAVSWWPPAIGWWLLAGIILLALFFAPRLFRYLTFKPLNKVADNTYQGIISEYQKHHDATRLVQDISKLLRQIAMTYTGRDASAQLTGNEWIASLNALTTENYFTTEIQQLLVYAPYQKTLTTEPQALILATQNWIKALPKKPYKMPRKIADKKLNAGPVK